MQKSTVQVGEKMSLSAFLIDLTCWWSQSGLADLEKTPNSCMFVYGRFFTQF